ncbi:RAQPRD family integrative conjugative element protein [Pseudomonas asiatica]|uniref:integrative conjugative element protein, RAQPRD family n=1 Tax=Pseudomonas asiatica TaxID=2219225 RepID=UPI00256FF050|nr:RAQPRD family integrative conjugative element protein [Pseudomonas asiatica]WJD72160.1 RAQPRD family integrative conjugative element protein [Pseudomonas asiatica]
MKTVPSTLLLTCLVSIGTAAQDAFERSDLHLMQRQISAIEQLSKRANSSSVDAASARYHFDYQRFSTDLNRVRQGINDYLSPSRAQPTDIVELTGQYRAEAPHSSHSDEHD